MARQIIDTTTNNGSYIGDPAKTAFEKTNANFGEIYSGNFTRTGNLSSSQVTSDQVFTSNGATVVLSSGANGGSAIIRPNGSGSSAGQAILFTSGTLSVASLSTSQSVTSSGSSLVLGSSGAGGSVIMRPNGEISGTGEAILYPSGTMTAVAFTPTSSADVKDYIEGFGGDACNLIDRLVVITHKYRPEFLDSDQTYLSLLAENVRDVIPSATDGDFDTMESVPYEKTVEVEIFDNDGNSVGVDYQKVLDYKSVPKHIPLGVSLMPIIALSIRSHQEKNKKIERLENAIEALTNRIEAAGL